jgi:hypothetical protein
MTRRFTASPATTHPADVDAARVAQCLVDNLPAHVAEAAERAADPEAVVREWLFSGGLQDPQS